MPQDSANQIVVIDQDGLRGLADAQGFEAQGQSQLTIIYDGNRHVQVPLAILQPKADGTYYLPLRLNTVANTAEYLSDPQGLVVPIVQEEVQVGKQRVETGRVRVTKKVHLEEEIVEALLKQQSVQVERVPFDQMVEEAPEVRYEGETLVIPVLEEVLVIEKRLILKEEVRITRQVQEIPHQEPVTLRREEISIERTEAST